MKLRILAVGGVVAVLGLGFLSSSLRSQTASKPPLPVPEQAGSLAVDEDAPPDAPFKVLPDNVMASQGHDPLEQQARSLYAQLKQRLSNTDAPSFRDVQLKTALDRYFADSQIEQAVRILEGVIKATPDTPEAHRAKGAIQMLRNREPTEDTIRQLMPATPRAAPARDDLRDDPLSDRRAAPSRR